MCRHPNPDDPEATRYETVTSVIMDVRAGDVDHRRSAMRRGVSRDPTGNRVTSTDLPRPGRRIHVVGTSCTGKTTLAADLAAAFNVPHVELDALHWGPDWTPIPQVELRDRVSAALSGEGWAVDGNYGSLRDIIWPRADTFLWLDYSLPLVLWRMLKRTARRIALQEELWNGNRESVRSFLFSRESLLLWALQTHGKHRREYPALLTKQENAHLAAVRFRSPRECRAWLAAAREPDARQRPASPR